MLYLIDTNVLLRRARPSDPLCPTAKNAIQTLILTGETLCVTPQNFIEYWNALTRPADKNGFGLSPTQADSEIQHLEKLFRLLPDTPDIYPNWRKLVVSTGVCGVQVHDARLVAVMLTHGVTHVLTFNATDFKRFSAVTAVDPKDV